MKSTNSGIVTRGVARRIIERLLRDNGGRFSRAAAKEEILKVCGASDDPSNQVGFAALDLSSRGLIFEEKKSRAEDQAYYVLTEDGRREILPKTN